MNLGSHARELGLYDLVEPIYSALVRLEWLGQGSPIPAPSAVKRRILAHHAAQYDLTVLVETGTFKGDTVRSLRRNFDRIYSIELDEHLYKKAAERCRRQGNATLLQGDSVELLPALVAALDIPALFWLDAHYSGTATAGVNSDPPILAELKSALTSDQPHVILIDDLRAFASGDPGYPSPEEIRRLADANGYGFATLTDIMVLTPKRVKSAEAS